MLLDLQQANASAQNALLKTLEEAPQKVILLLSADSADNLLPTIASRCEIMRLRPASISVLENALISRWQIPNEKARLLAHLANGRVGTALRYADEPELLETRSALLDDLQHIMAGSRRDRFAYGEAQYRNREQLRAILQVWYTYARDLMLVVNSAADQITNLDRETDLQALAAKVMPVQALQMVQAIDRAVAALDSNGHLRLLLDTLFLDFPQIH